MVSFDDGLGFVGAAVGTVTQVMYQVCVAIGAAHAARAANEHR